RVLAFRQDLQIGRVAGPRLRELAVFVQRFRQPEGGYCVVGLPLQRLAITRGGCLVIASLKIKVADFNIFLRAVRVVNPQLADVRLRRLSCAAWLLQAEPCLLAAGAALVGRAWNRLALRHVPLFLCRLLLLLPVALFRLVFLLVLGFVFLCFPLPLLLRGARPAGMENRVNAVRSRSPQGTLDARRLLQRLLVLRRCGRTARGSLGILLLSCVLRWRGSAGIRDLGVRQQRRSGRVHLLGSGIFRLVRLWLVWRLRPGCCCQQKCNPENTQP